MDAITQFIPNPIAEKAVEYITKKKNIDSFVDEVESSTDTTTSSINNSPVTQIISFVKFLICLFALFKAFKCGGGFVHFLAACCCSPCYLAYVYGALEGCAG
jgi:hypothetical protein